MDRIADIPVFIGFAFGGEGGGSGDAWIGVVGGLFGAILGAGVSGAISLYLQRKEHNRADVLRATDLKQRQRSIAHRILVKLIALHSDMERVGQHLRLQIKQAGPRDELWQVVVPLHIGAEDIHFDGEETALFLDLELHEAFNAAGALPGIHNQQLSLMKLYSAKREEMRAMLKPEAFESLNSLRLSEADVMRTAPLRAEMNDMLIFSRDHIEQTITESRDALALAYAGFKEKLDIKFEMDVGQLTDGAGLPELSPVT